MDFEIQSAKGSKDRNITVEWAVRQCDDPILEPKYDGWRIVIIRTADGVRVFGGRNGKEYTGQAPEIEAAAMAFPPGTILDGELVAMTMGEDGLWCSNFTTVQTAMASKIDGPKAVAQKIAREKLRYIAFDLIRYAGGELGHLPLADRRTHLEVAINRDQPGALISATIQLPATQESHDALVASGMEGSIVKDLTKPYAFGKKGHGFFKLKGTTTIDVVVMDLPLDGKGQHLGKVGRMVCGAYRDGSLDERCKVNAPNNLERLQMTNDPDAFIGRIAEVKVYGFDAKTGSPRHPTFLRWREDKVPTDCKWSNEQ